MEQLHRFKLMVGNENMEKINNLTILIIGLGGVGGYALEGIVRCGVKKVIIVDNDKIDVTNLNRQIISLNSNIGKSKTDVAEERIKDINNNVEVKKINEFINEENINLLFEEKIDYLIDACDTISTKKQIIRECIKRKINFITCMGTGKRLDPQKLKIIDVRKTNYDPIAKIIRKMVKEENIKEKIITICSEEQPIKTDEKVIASNSFIPAIAGLMCTSYIINDVIKGE